MLQKIHEFVKKHTMNRSNCHGYGHAVTVMNNATMLGCHDERAKIVSLIHDVADHKFDTTIEVFKEINIDPQLVDLAQDVSFSVEQSSQIDYYEKYGQELATILDYVKSADRLEALGRTGILRCIMLNRDGAENRQQMVNNIIKHCHEKLYHLHKTMKYGKPEAHAATSIITPEYIDQLVDRYFNTYFEIY